jgi:CRP/FNR family transcriptional regulator, cyclic AMP receptor protein
MDPDRLTRIAVFSELAPDELRRLATFATEASVPAGERILREGDFSTELIAIEEGTAAIRHDGQTLGTVGPGDVVGEIGLLRKAQRNADVIANSPMRLIKLSHWEIRRMSRETLSRIEAVVQQRQRTQAGPPAEPLDS